MSRVLPFVGRPAGEKRRQPESGPRGFSSEIYVIADAEVFILTEGNIRAAAKGEEAGSRRVSSPRHAFKGILQELGKASSVSRRSAAGKPAVKGNQRSLATGWEDSYEPIVPMKVGNRRAMGYVAATGPSGGKG